MKNALAFLLNKVGVKGDPVEIENFMDELDANWSFYNGSLWIDGCGEARYRNGKWE